MWDQLFYTIVDKTLNGGLGAVTQKNVIELQDSLNSGIGVCKHANGRDWWIVVTSHNSDLIYKVLLTPSGISSITSQHTGLPAPYFFAGSVQFSPDGNNFTYSIKYLNSGQGTHNLRILDFDRCTGMFSNPQTVKILSPVGGFCIAFSPNSKYIYFGSFNTLFQVNTDTSDIAASLDTIAIEDNYCYPFSFTCTNFWYGYLAAKGKIYVTSGSGNIDLNYINKPDSDGISCDMRQHALRIPCYSARGNVYHPNYYLGPVIGSACDTLSHVGIYELSSIKNLSVKPNPVHDGNFRVSYLMPQNQNGILTIRNLMGEKIYQMNLPTWSTMQDLNLPQLHDGVYFISVTSGNAISTKRLVVFK